MKLKLTLLGFVLLCGANLQAQNDIEKLIVGRWDTADTNGDSIAIYFQEDQSMYIVVDNQEFGRGEVTRGDGSKVKVMAKYKVSTTTSPVQLDYLFFVNDFNNQVGKQEGIIQVLDNNTIRIRTAAQRTIKPKDFTSLTETRIYFRHGTANNVTDCANVKDGKFKVENTPLGDMHIERKGDTQLQTFPNGFKNKIKVIWTGSCTFDLIPLENYVNNKWEKDTTGTVMHVSIVHVRKDSFFYISTYNNAPLNITGEMIRLKD